MSGVLQSRMRPKLIINADDFGLCESVNRAVIEAHGRGVLTSATVMVNMPAAQQAAELSREHKSLGVGLHLNLLEGEPVLQAGQTEALVGDDGQFCFSAVKLGVMSMLSGRLRRAIAAEAKAQIEKFLDLGFKAGHIDSHKHIHMLPAVFKITAELAEKYKFRFLRYCYEPGWFAGQFSGGLEFSDKLRRLEVNLSSLYCKKFGTGLFANDYLYGLAHTGGCDEAFWQHLSKALIPGKTAEVMVHPGYPDGLDRRKTRLIEQRLVELKALCSENTKRFLAQAGAELVHYGML